MVHRAVIPAKAGSQSAFSLLELLVTMAILLIISAAVFGLLSVAQVRYRNEQQLLDSFQTARAGMDQLVREIHNAGTPPLSTYGFTDCAPSTWPTTACSPNEQRQFAISFRGYDTTYNYTLPATQNCTVGGTCGVPDSYDLSMEMDLDPYNTLCPNLVEIVEYKLQDDGNGFTGTLMRRVTEKPLAANWAVVSGNCLPLWNGWSSTSNAWVPFVENVVNQHPAANGLGTATNIPLFTFGCDVSTACVPQNINQVYINMWVRSASPDLQTNQIRTIQLQANAQRLSPDL